MAASHAVSITLSEADRTMLQNWTRRRSTAQALALRARIVLACAEPGITNREVGARLEVCEMTVSKWRRRFAALGVDGLVDAPRSGAPRTILDDQVERVIVTTLESVPRMPRTGAPEHWRGRWA
jgi:transposase-like protein